MVWLKHKLQQLLIQKNDNVFVQFFRSIFVGGLATLVDWAIYFLLAVLLHVNPFLATSISFVFGLVVNYYFTQIWVFSYTPDSLTKSFATFTIIGLVGLGLNYLLFWIDDTYHLLENIFNIGNQDYINMLKKVIATFIVYIWNFSARKYFIFRESKKTQLKTEPEVNPR
jgi:putative flippase GtrA